MGNALRAVPNPPESATQSGERAAYERIFAHSQDMVFLVDPGTEKIVFANPKAIEDTSYEAEEIESLPFSELFPEEDREAIKSLLDATHQFKTGVDPQRNLRRKTGRKLITEISTSVVELDGREAFFCNVRDITARVKAENEIRKMNAELEDRVRARTAELAAQKRELEDVMNHIQQAIVTISPEGLLNAEFSAHVLQIFGESRQVGGTPIAEFLYSGEEIEKSGGIVRDSLLMAFGNFEHWALIQEMLPREILFEGKDLELDWVPILAVPAEGAEDQPARLAKVMLICLDVTEAKRLKAEIARQESQHSERLEMISRMLGLPAATVDQFLGDQKRVLTEVHATLQTPVNEFGIESMNSLFRALHTLKGAAAQFELISIRDKAHAIEEQIAAQIEKEKVSLVVATKRKELESLYKAAEKLPSNETVLTRIADLMQVRFSENLLETQRGEFLTGFKSKMEELGLSITEMQAFAERIFKGGSGVGSGPTSAGGGLQDCLLAKLESAVSTGKVDVENLARVPIRFLWDRLESIALATAKELGREFRIERKGDSVEIDYRWIGPLYDGLLHTIRNSLDHGYDSPEERKLKGKNGIFCILLDAQISHTPKSHISLYVSDDGKGVDLSRVREKAGPKAQALDDTSALQLIFEPGFSTRDQVTELSGRGVGLDQLRDTVTRKFKGTVSAESRPDQGIRFEITLPLVTPETVEQLGLATRLGAGAEIRSVSITEYEKKPEVVDEVTAWARKLPVFSEMATILGTIADEMIMNGMFDAPRTKDGKEKYNHLPRTTPLVLEPSEAVTLSYGATKNWIGVSIRDPFGALTSDVVFRNIGRGLAQGRDQISTRSGGAGLGLFTIYENAQAMIVEVRQGRSTEVIALIAPTRAYSAYQKAPRSFEYIPS